tara:strand:- start:515 stop:658 length:144 start_codon:yes stop_codon:yes gene_type:complete
LKTISKDDAFAEIAALIYYQDSLKNQDRWLKRVMDAGLWKPLLEEED